MRDCQYGIDAGNPMFAPRVHLLLLRDVAMDGRRRLDRDLDATMAPAPINQDGKVRCHLFTFLEHPDARPNKNGSGQELRPTVTYSWITGGFRSLFGANPIVNI